MKSESGRPTSKTSQRPTSCVPEPFDIIDMRHPRPVSRAKYSSPLKHIPLTTFGTTVRWTASGDDDRHAAPSADHPSAAAALMPSSSIEDAISVTTSAHRGDDHHNNTNRKSRGNASPPPPVPRPSAWGAPATHVLAFNTHATEEYLIRHPSVAAKVDAVEDTVSYRTLLRPEEAQMAARRSEEFYDSATGQRLTVAEYVHRYRVSSGEQHSADVKSLYDGRPLSTFGRSAILPDAPTGRHNVTSPGPLDFALPVRTETPKLQSSTMRGGPRGEVCFSRCGLVGLRQSRSPTPLSELIGGGHSRSQQRSPSASKQPGAKRKDSALPPTGEETRAGLSECDSILATRPTSTMTQGKREVGSGLYSCAATPASAVSPLDPPLRTPPPGGLVVPYRNAGTPSNQALRSPPQEQTTSSPLTLAPLAYADDDLATALTGRPPPSAQQTATTRAPSAASSVLERAAASRAKRTVTPADDGGRRTASSALSATLSPAVKGSDSATTTVGSPPPQQEQRQVDEVPQLLDLLADTHFPGIGGTWIGTKFISTGTTNAKYKAQEDRRRKLLRIQDSTGSDDIPESWLRRPKYS